MLIKSTDDKSKRLALLEDLQKSTLLDTRQKDWLRDELRRCTIQLAGFASFSRFRLRVELLLGLAVVGSTASTCHASLSNSTSSLVWHSQIVNTCQPNETS